MKKSHFKTVIGLFIVSLGFLVLRYVFLNKPLLPSDEEMINHFSTNRSDFEELVRRYREYPRTKDKDSSLWFKEGDTLDIYKRAGIDRMSINIGIWLPNPYSDVAQQAIKDSVKQREFYKIQDNFSTLEIKRLPSDRFSRISLIHNVIWKDYIFLPQVPVIENDYLLFPIKMRTGKWSGSRLLDSLDSYPENWKDYECVYRQIDKQWFLRLCNGH